MVSGATIVGFRLRARELVVIPYVDGELMSGESEVLDEHPGLAAWWREAERLWEKHKSKGSNLSLLGRINYQRGLQHQFPIPAHRVVYTTSGQYLAACRLDDPEAVVDSSLYWTAVAGIDEGRYLTAILNSDPLAEQMRPLQARGEHNPRHFHLLPLDVTFPEYDADDPLHRQLVDLAKRAEAVAADVVLDPGKRFETARRAIREALAEDGAGDDLTAVVRRLLVAAATAPSLVGG
jgi:hypothetical protein